MEVKPGSRGKSAPCLTIDIVDDKGGSLPAGEVGHIAAKVKPVHPVGVFRGYIGNGKSNHDAFRGDRYFTGDKAYKDQDGYFWFVGRVDDVIKSSGYRIGPFEVESILQSHSAVAENAVVEVPDRMRGTI